MFRCEEGGEGIATCLLQTDEARSQNAEGGREVKETSVDNFFTAKSQIL